MNEGKSKKVDLAKVLLVIEFSGPVCSSSLYSVRGLSLTQCLAGANRPGSWRLVSVEVFVSLTPFRSTSQLRIFIH